MIDSEQFVRILMLVPRVAVPLLLLAGAASSLPIIILNPIFVSGAAKQHSTAVPNGFFAVRTRSVEIPPDLSTVQIELWMGEVRYPVTPVEPPRGVVRQVWGVIPPGLPPGQASVTVSIGGLRMTDVVEIADTAPGLFTANYDGYGPAIATHLNGARVALTLPARPGQEIALYATGLGGAGKGDVGVEVAGQPAIVVSSGAQADFRGLDQVNFIMPVAAFQGCYVPVQLRVRGVLSNVATLAVSASGACQHPFGLREGELRTLDEGGLLPLGRVQVTSSYYDGLGWSWKEGVSVDFPVANANLLYALAGPQMPESQMLGCPAWDDNLSITVPTESPDVGSAMTFQGPRSRGLTLPAPFYSSSAPPLDAPFFVPGQWQLSAPGGVGIAGFSQSLSMPPVPANLNIHHGDRLPAGRGLTITWNAAGYSDTDLAVIRIGGGTHLYNWREVPQAYLACRVRARDGGISIPQSAMDPLGGGPIIRLTVMPDPAARATTRLTLADGEEMILYSDFQLTYIAQVLFEWDQRYGG